jgi:hypothetical protein
MHFECFEISFPSTFSEMNLLFRTQKHRQSCWLTAGSFETVSLQHAWQELKQWFSKFPKMNELDECKLTIHFTLTSTFPVLFEAKHEVDSTFTSQLRNAYLLGRNPQG